MSGSTRTFSNNNSSVSIRGSKLMKAVIAMEIAAADLLSGGDVIPLMELPPEAIVTSIKVLADDLDGATDLIIDIGIWGATQALSLDELVAAGAFEALDQDIYVDGSTAFRAVITSITEILGSGSNAVDLDDRFSTVRTLAGHTLTSGTMPSKYFLGMKADNGSGASVQAGGLYVEVEWVQG